jgi:cyclase
MDKDGTKSGYDLDLTNRVSKSLSIPVIASGGVGTLEHIRDGIQKGGASAVLAASIFHFGEFSINQVKEYLKSQSVSVRI